MSTPTKKDLKALFDLLERHPLRIGDKLVAEEKDGVVCLNDVTGATRMMLPKEDYDAIKKWKADGNG